MARLKWGPGHDRWSVFHLDWKTTLQRVTRATAFLAVDFDLISFLPRDRLRRRISDNSRLVLIKGVTILEDSRERIECQGQRAYRGFGRAIFLANIFTDLCGTIYFHLYMDLLGDVCEIDDRKTRSCTIFQKYIRILG